MSRDLRLERNVAVKTLTDLSALTRFKPEAWAMAELSHPAVAQGLRHRVLAGHLFLVAEYLAGGSLADRLAGWAPDRNRRRPSRPLRPATAAAPAVALRGAGAEDP